MAVSAPPKKKATTTPTEPVVKSREKKIDEIINRGSSTVAKAQPQEAEQVKNMFLASTAVLDGPLGCDTVAMVFLMS